MRLLEQQIGLLEGVVSARYDIDADGRESINVLALPGRPRETIALEARSIALVNGVQVPLDAVKVVQFDSVEQPQPGTSSVDIDLVEETWRGAGGDDRPVVENVEVATEQGRGHALVTLRSRGASATGSAAFVNAAASMRRGVAEAALAGFSALTSDRARLAVDNAFVVSAAPHHIAVVTVAIVTDDDEQVLVGATLVGSNGEFHALVRAALDAINRWSQRPQRSPSPSARSGVSPASGA